MSIAETAAVVRPESAAKNGTLGSQTGAGVKQVILDTNINTNNGDLATSPTLAERFIVIERGENDEEVNAIVSVEADGVTCNMFDTWDTQPASGDTYEVSYVMADVATKTGCSIDSQGRFVMTKRLVVGNGTAFAYLGAGKYQTIEFADGGSTSDALKVANAGWFHIGTIKNNKPTKGATLLFTHNGDGETCITLDAGSQMKIYDSVAQAVEHPQGITLNASVNASADLQWRRVKVLGINMNMETIYTTLTGQDGSDYDTVGDILNETTGYPPYRG